MGTTRLHLVIVIMRIGIVAGFQRGCATQKARSCDPLGVSVNDLRRLRIFRRVASLERVCSRVERRKSRFDTADATLAVPNGDASALDREHASRWFLSLSEIRQTADRAYAPIRRVVRISDFARTDTTRRCGAWIEGGEIGIEEYWGSKA